MKDLFKVAEKVALVTGGRRGIGKSLALALSQSGAKVYVVAKNPDAGQLVAEIEAAGSECQYESVDLLQPDQRKGLISRVVKRFGRLDILVNNAGVQHKQNAMDYELAKWDEDVGVMLTAVLDLSQQAARHMSTHGGGKIIHLASISSYQGARNIIGYSTVKHALLGMTKCMSNEWAGMNINVNAIAPGIIETEMAAEVLNDPAKSAQLLGRIPSGRFGKPDDLHGSLIFLASEASKHMHGQVLVLDGGWLGR